MNYCINIKKVDRQKIENYFIYNDNNNNKQKQ